MASIALLRVGNLQLCGFDVINDSMRFENQRVVKDLFDQPEFSSITPHFQK